MRTAFSVLLPFSLVFVFATTAAATVTLNAIGTILTGANTGSNDTRLAETGDQVQIDIFAFNGGGALTGASFSAGVSGGGLGDLQFDGGATADRWFVPNIFKFSPPTEPAISNQAGTSSGFDGLYTVGIPRTLTSEDLSANGSVRFLDGTLVGQSPATGFGGLDLGIRDGATSPFGGTPNTDVAQNGAAHARLLFTLVGNFSELEIGQSLLDDFVVDENDPGGVGAIIGTTIEIGVIPEPGTALLLGLGIVGLAVRRL